VAEGEGTLVIVLARVRTDVEPEVPAVAHTTCTECDRMVWVDALSYARLMSNEDIWPMCLDCAEQHAAEHPEAWVHLMPGSG
jgi:RNase P subunit RPR2